MQLEFHPVCIHGISLEAKCAECDKENSRSVFDHIENWADRDRVIREVRWGVAVVLVASLLILILLAAI